jgi:hypothetical protein
VFAHRGGVDQRHVALHDAGVFERLHAAQTRRRREVDALRQFKIRQARVLLQLIQDGPVNRIKFRLGRYFSHTIAPQ